MEDSVENEYIVTDENGCATEPSIFGDWEYQAETNSLLASFNAFKFPSSDNIRFQCNIRVCFGRCQPVNCHGANAYGKRRRRAITDMNEIEMMLNRTRRATSSNTALASDDTLGIEGTLREEITIQSNAILTLERREERSYDSDNSKFHLGDRSESKILKQLFLFHFSYSRRSTCRRYLRINDRTHHRTGDNSAVGTGGRGCGSLLLANGLPETSNGNRTTATSAGIPEPTVCPPRTIGALARLHDIKAIDCVRRSPTGKRWRSQLLSSKVKKNNCE